MAIATWAAFQDFVRTPDIQFSYCKIIASNPNTISNSLGVDLWTLLGSPAGTTPSTAVALNSGSAGAIPLPGLTGTNAFTHFQLPVDSYFGNTNTSILVIDRLSHQGGLAGNTISPQTTNLPTAALTRYTSGVGVMVGLHCITDFGTSASTATISYTNSGGTAGRTGTVYLASPTSARLNLFPMALQAGDVGARSVESVTLSASGTTGNFGIVLFRPLVYVSGKMNEPNTALNITNWAEPVLDGACLDIIVQNYVSSGAGVTITGGIGAI